MQMYIIGNIIVLYCQYKGIVFCYKSIVLLIQVYNIGSIRVLDWGSIPGRVIPKTQKWYLMPP